MKGSECCYGHKTKLSAFSFGIAWGVVAGLCMMLFAWYSFWSGHEFPMIAQWGEVYPGYAATIIGGLIGGGWGFIEGFVFGVIFGWIYNACLCCCRGYCKPSEEEISKKK